MAGSVFTTGIKDIYGDFENPTCTSHCFGAINVGAFGPVSDFKESMDKFIRSVKTNPKAKGIEEIFLPGEIELRLKNKRMEEGIPLARIILDELKREGELCSATYDLE